MALGCNDTEIKKSELWQRLNSFKQIFSHGILEIQGFIVWPDSII